MKKDNFTTPVVLNFERLWLLHVLSLWLTKTFYLFLPIYEWTNTLKLVGKKANTKSNQDGEELFGLRDWIKSQTSTTGLANKDTVRCLDWIFQEEYFLSLSIYHVSLHKDIPKKVTTAVLYTLSSENLSWSLFYWHQSSNGIVMTPSTCLCISRYQDVFQKS